MLETLALYPASLPKKTFPSPLDANPPEQTCHPGLLSFQVDPTWVEDVGKEGAINRELEAALGTRDDSHTFIIKERGPGIQALVPILRESLKEIPKSVIIQKWLDAGIASARACYKAANVALPGDTAATTVASQSQATAKDSAATPSTGSDTDAAKTPGYKQQHSTLGKNHLKKTSTKILDDYADPDYIDTDEEEDNRKGGKKLFWVLPYITKRYHPANDPSAKMVRCVSNKNGCKGVWTGARRDKKRVLVHAVSCGYVLVVCNIDDDVGPGAQARAAPNLEQPSYRLTWLEFFLTSLCSLISARRLRIPF